MWATRKSEQDRSGALPLVASEVDVSVIIVSYNCRSVLEHCLGSVAREAGSLNCEIIVVDNNSTDATADWLRENRPDVRLVSNDTNRGFAGACNQGIRTARGRCILLVNPDTVVGKGAIRKTYDYLQEHMNLGAAGCKVLLPSGKTDPSCRREFPSPWDALCRMTGLSFLFPHSRVFARYDARYIDDHKRQEVPLIDGCYMMIRREALEDVGLFDERFFMYAEEMDWCRRAGRHGWSIGYDPSATIMHIKGEITRHSTFRMLYHFHRSMALYYRKHHNQRNPICIVVYAGILLRLVLLTLWNLVRAERRVSG